MKVVEAQSFKERLEDKFRFQDKHHHKSNIDVVLTKPEGSYLLKQWIPGGNIVTNAGDEFYARKAVDLSAITNANFKLSRCELANPSSVIEPAKTFTYGNLTSAITASRKAITTGYPKVSDNDPDNTGPVGVDIITYAYFWNTGDFNANGIFNGVLYEVASPSAGTLLLSFFKFLTAFNKGTADTMKLFANHEQVGV